MVGQITMRGRIQKSQPKRPKGLSAADHEIIQQSPTHAVSASAQQVNLPPLLRLPGEIRNRIYDYTFNDDEFKQSLLVHRPRYASLRPRKFASNRAFFGLTQVCRTARHEYRPIYLKKQEVGVNLNNASAYINAFYNGTTGIAGNCGNGNFTFAIDRVIHSQEKEGTGIDVWPMILHWATASNVEAGFGRYLHQCRGSTYDAGDDGEAKDLYRLFGRKVLDNGECTRAINMHWRAVLQSRRLAKIVVVRDPRPTMHQVPPVPAPGMQHVQIAPYSVNFQMVPSTLPPTAPQHPQYVRVKKPFISILFRYNQREGWMVRSGTATVNPNYERQLQRWLRRMGFNDMEHFEVQVDYVR